MVPECCEMLGSQVETFRLSMICDVFYGWISADMHYSCKMSGGSQVGPSLSVQIYTSKRLSRIFGLAQRGDGVNAILDKGLMLSELGVTDLNNQ